MNALNIEYDDGLHLSYRPDNRLIVRREGRVFSVEAGDLVTGDIMGHSGRKIVSLELVPEKERWV